MALERGILPELFWESSVLEVVDMINARDRLREADIRQQVELQFNAADLIGNRIAIVFGDPKKHIHIIQPWEIYPDLFEDRSEEIQEQKELRETVKYKDDLRTFAARWNGRNKQK